MRNDWSISPRMLNVQAGPCIGKNDNIEGFVTPSIASIACEKRSPHFSPIGFCQMKLKNWTNAKEGQESGKQTNFLVLQDK